MSTLDPRQVFRVPGRLCVGPTQNGLLTAFPHGGTALGFFEYGEVVVDQDSEDIVSEATGKRVGKLLAETIVGFEFDLVQFDTDALKKVWAITTNTLREPSTGGTVSPGIAPTGSPLLFSPDDHSYPALLVFNPVWRHGSKRIPHYQDSKRRERIIVDAIDDAAGSGHTWACDLLSSLSLT